VTVNRRPVAELRPLPPRPAWVPGSELEEVVRSSPADPALLEDLEPLRTPAVEPA
jgi:hypothetical protein